MSEFDNAALLEDVKERGSLPANDLRFTEARLLAAGTRELREAVATLLVETRAEHLVYTYTTPAVIGQATYRMPERAVLGALRDVVWIDSSGTAAPPLREISSDSAEALNPGSGTPTAYYTRNYSVVLVPIPNVAGTVSMPHYARPNRLVLVAEDPAVAGAAVIVAVAYNAGAQTLIVSAVDPPTGLQPPSTAVAIDIVRATPGFETLLSATAEQVFVQEPSPGTWTYEISGVAANPGVAAGDYLCLAGESPVPQVPVELHGLLAARTAKRLVGAVGDAQAKQLLMEEVADLEARARAILSPRVSAHTQPAGGSIAEGGLATIGGGLVG
jgi:hypothetical protein